MNKKLIIKFSKENRIGNLYFSLTLTCLNLI